MSSSIRRHFRIDRLVATMQRLLLRIVRVGRRAGGDDQLGTVQCRKEKTEGMMKEKTDEEV
jgi:hypothetical protein